MGCPHFCEPASLAACARCPFYHDRMAAIRRRERIAWCALAVLVTLYVLAVCFG